MRSTPPFIIAQCAIKHMVTTTKGYRMDKKIKSLIKDTKKLESKEKNLLKADKKNDKIIEKAKKKLKG